MKNTEKFARQWMPAMKKLLALFAISMLLCVTALSQERTVTGVIKDASGTGLPGVNVVVKGTSNGVITDLDGNFSIKVPNNNAVLAVSYIGYTTQEIQVGDKTAIDFVLEEEVSKLDEVVVIGYGTMKKKLTTGANLHVGNEDIENMHSLRIEQALQGMSPGVQITANSGQPGEAMKVRIRGVGTVGNSEPIYIVDGTPVKDISYLNPSDIESVDVLKDAASSAIYGTRAANGVLLITTKKGTKGGMLVSLDMYMGVQNPYKKLDMLNSDQYIQIYKEKIENAKLTAKEYDKQTRLIDSVAGIAQNTNWIDEMFRQNTPMKNIALSINGSTEKSTYSSSISYFSQEGIIGSKSQSSFERISARLSTENKLYKDIVKVGENIIFTHSLKKGIGVGDKSKNVVRAFANASPIYKVYDYSRPVPDSLDNFGMSPWSDESNPVASMYYKYQSETKTNQLVGDIYAEIEPIKGLRFKTDLGMDMSYANYNEFMPHYYLSSNDQNTYSYAIQSVDMNLATNFENNITYKTSFNNNNITAMIGNTVWQSSRYYVYGQKYGLIFNSFDYAILDNGTIDTTANPSGTKLDRAMLSYYGRVNYDYNEKYLFTFTLRRDGSSKFGPANRWANFPSASAGWIVTQEEFAKINNLDFLKLRASWGRNGNDQLPDYLYESTVSSKDRAYYFGSQENKAIGTSPDVIANPSLKWEQSEQINIGFDAKIFKNFTIAFDWYKKTTIDLLVNVPISDVAGAGNTELANSTKIYMNAGDVSNKGYELSLGYQRFFGDLSVKVDANMAYNKNEVTRINNKDGIIHGEESVLFNGCSEVYRAEVGYPIGYFYGYKTAGIFQNQNDVNSYTAIDSAGNPLVDKKGNAILIQPKAQPGDIKMLDLNRNGKIDDGDRTMIGNPYPDYTYGFNLNIGYKGIDFGIVAQGVYGCEILYNYRVMERDITNYTTDILNRWHGEGTSNKIPRVTLANKDFNNNYKLPNDAVYIFDGSYLKIRSVNLGYDLSSSLLKNKIKKCRIYVSALNVLTITNYPGMDPEVGYGSLDSKRYENYSSGIDIGYYPVPTSYIAGLQLTF